MRAPRLLLCSEMNRRFVSLLFVGILFVGGLFLGSCATDLTVEDTDNRGPAPYSPDATSHLPTPVPDPILGTPRI